MDYKEEKLLHSEDKEKNVIKEKSVSNISSKKISKSSEKEIFTGDQKITADQLSSNNNNFMDSSVNEKINSLTSLPLKKQRELIAILHTKTETIGNFNTDVNINYCPCCNKQIPKPFSYKKEFHSSELFDYGIDLINFNSLTKMFYGYLKYFWAIAMFFSLLSLCLNAKDWWSDLKSFFDTAGKDRYFFFFDQVFYSQLSKETLLNLLFCLGCAAVLIILFMQVLKKISLNMKKYRMNILQNKAIEETLFSVFVKGLPKLTDKEELKQFLEDEYKVVIRDVILLNDYSVLESLKKKLDYFYETSDVTQVQLENVLSQISHYALNIERNSCAIIIFEQIEDRLLFFREFFNLKEILYMYFKKNFVFRGKRIYFEPVPSLKMIDWNNCKYSVEKTLSNTKIKYLISFVGSGLIYSAVYFAIYFVSVLKPFNSQIWDALVVNLILLVLNVLLKFALTLVISSFKLSDNYLKEILKAYFIACRNVNNTVMINLLLYASGNKSDYSILFLIILQNLKLGFLSMFNFDYIFRNLSYKLYYKNKLKTQETLNDILGANTFNFMTSWEGFKLCFLLMVFSLMKSFTLGLFAFVFLIVHFYMIKYSFVNSRIRDFNNNYYGFYFSHTFNKEFLITGKFFLVYSIAIFDKNAASSALIVNLVADFALDILNSKSLYNKFYVKEKYNNVKFTKKFEDEKFVNTKLYMEAIELLAEKIKKNME